MIGRPALLLAGALLAAIALGSSASAQGVAAEDRDRVELIDRVAKSVVHVRVEQETPAVVGTPASTDRELEALLDKYAGRRARKPEEGSGFVIDSARRLVLTAAHIVDNAKSITVGLPGGGTDPAQVVGIDPEGGIALLRAATELPALALADREPKPGETALIVGWMIPLKSVMPVEGMVMGAAPAVDDSPAAPPFARYVALDAVIPNGGFGGSPVLDQSGKVIGMVSAIYGRDYGPGSLTMMIPTAAMAHHVSQLAAAGKVTRSGIGITVD